MGASWAEHSTNLSNPTQGSGQVGVTSIGSGWARIKTLEPEPNLHVILYHHRRHVSILASSQKLGPKKMCSTEINKQRITKNFLRCAPFFLVRATVQAGPIFIITMSCYIQLKSAQ